MPDANARPVYYVIPHTHWEGAVFKTREAYLEMGLCNILRALALLADYPDYRFTLDQVCYVRPFLDRYPQHAGAFRRFVEEGRLAIVGGTDSMLDVNMPGGESFVRQVLLGKRYFRQALGVDVTTGWQLDTFGHHAQMPQLLRLAGFETFWFFRGVPSWQTPTEFLWEGLDGTRIPAYWLVNSYAVTYGSPAELPGFRQALEGSFHSLDAYARPDHRVGPGGADVCRPEEHLPVLVPEYNALPDAELELRLATPAEYEAATAADEWPTIRCELNPIFQGIYSSRIELKQWTRALEAKLGAAEALGAALRLQGAPVDAEELWPAWEPMLFNQAHDLMSGVMTDHVWDDTVRSFDCSRRRAEAAVDQRLTAYAQATDTTGEGQALIVYNPLSWARTDIAHATVGWLDRNVRGLRVIAPDGGEVPAQVLSADSRPDGTLVEARIAFLATGVPPLGHAVFHVLPLHDAEPLPQPSSVTEAVLENEHLLAVVDGRTGLVRSLLLKSDNWEALAAPGNLIVQEPDHGDLWEPYRPLDGASRIAMTDRHPLPPRGAGVFSDDFAAESATLIQGPVLQELRLSRPFGERGELATTFRLWAGARRLEIHTELLNNDEAVRYRVAFPSSLPGAVTTHEIPFGAIERPEGIEFPAQNWADLSDGAHGLGLLNRGLPGNATVGSDMLLSLCRSTRIVAYGFGGGYEPGMGSDSGLELGKRLAFDYALQPHAGDFAQAALWRAGLELNHPLLVQPAASHQGPLGAVASVAQVSPDNVVVSALMPSADDASVVLRLYEAAGQSTPSVRVLLPEGVSRAQVVNLLEDPLAALDVVDGTVELELSAFQIVTLKLS